MANPTNLSSLLAAVVDYVADEIERGNPSYPAIPRAFRYHGGPVPDDCCTEEGVLSCWFDPLRATQTFPTQLPVTGPFMAGFPMATLHLRFSICWPKLQRTAGQPVLDDKGWDARAARLADAAESGTRALIRLSCGDPGTALWDEVLENTPCDSFRFIDCKPTKPQGGCAAVAWSAYASLRGQPAVS